MYPPSLEPEKTPKDTNTHRFGRSDLTAFQTGVFRVPVACCSRHPLNLWKPTNILPFPPISSHIQQYPPHPMSTNILPYPQISCHIPLISTNVLPYPTRTISPHIHSAHRFFGGAMMEQSLWNGTWVGGYYYLSLWISIAVGGDRELVRWTLNIFKPY